MSVSIVVLEVVFHAISAPLGTHDILILAALCALLSVAPWLGITGDLLYVAVFAAMGAFSSSLAFSVLGVFLVAAVWIIRHRTAQAALLLAGYVLLMFWQNGSVLARMASDVLLSSVAVVVGFAVRKFMDGAELSRRELEESRMGTVRAVESVRAKLAAGLHDTIARDLARISISLESLAAAHPDLSGEIAPIVDLAHDSSRRLRPMISELSLDAAAPSLAAAVEESRLMLRSGALELDAHMPGDIDGEISRQTILTGSLFVSETAANALKYARRGDDGRPVRGDRRWGTVADDGQRHQRELFGLRANGRLRPCEPEVADRVRGRTVVLRLAFRTVDRQRVHTGSENPRGRGC